MEGLGMTPNLTGQSILGMSTNPNDLKGRDLESVATEFEGVFVSMLLKEMRNTLGEEGGLFGGESSDSYGSMFDMFMGKHIAGSKPLGIADVMMRGYENRNGTRDDSKPSMSIKV